MNTSKDELQNIVKLVRRYAHRLLDGIELENLTWTPPETQGKSILYYFAHIINAEIFWLKHLGDESFEYVDKKASFADGLELYELIQKHLIEKVETAPEEELVLLKPVFENQMAVKPGSLAWMIWRTSMHAVHHYAQIAYIRHARNNPPEESGDYSWSKVMDEIVRLGHSS